MSLYLFKKKPNNTIESKMGCLLHNWNVQDRRDNMKKHAKRSVPYIAIGAGMIIGYIAGVSQCNNPVQGKSVEQHVQYVDKPVVFEKAVYVDKPVIVEKAVYVGNVCISEHLKTCGFHYVDKPVYVDKVVNPDVKVLSDIIESVTIGEKQYIRFTDDYWNKTIVPEALSKPDKTTYFPIVLTKGTRQEWIDDPTPR